MLLQYLQYIVLTKGFFFIFFYRFTPTSAGPNSFGKTKYGFIDTKKVFEKNLKEAALQINEEEKKAKKKI